MSDIREDVAKIVARPMNLIGDNFPWERLGDGWKRDCLHIADKCITAAEPHLRRKHRQELLDELIAAAAGSFIAAGERLVILGEDLEFASIEDWLEFRKEAE